MADYIEHLRRGYEAWNAGNLDELLSPCHPDITIRPLVGAVVAAGEYHGHDEARQLFENARRPWSEFRSKGDAFTIDGHVAHLAEFRDGLVVSLEGFRERDEAAQSVGR